MNDIIYEVYFVSNGYRYRIISEHVLLMKDKMYVEDKDGLFQSEWKYYEISDLSIVVSSNNSLHSCLKGERYEYTGR